MNGPFTRCKKLGSRLFPLSWCTRLTDGQTDGQTEGRQQYRAFAFAVAR